MAALLKPTAVQTCVKRLFRVCVTYTTTTVMSLCPLLFMLHVYHVVYVVPLGLYFALET